MIDFIAGFALWVGYVVPLWERYGTLKTELIVVLGGLLAGFMLTVGVNYLIPIFIPTILVYYVLPKIDYKYGKPIHF